MGISAGSYVVAKGIQMQRDTTLEGKSADKPASGTPPGAVSSTPANGAVPGASDATIVTTTNPHG